MAPVGPEGANRSFDPDRMRRERRARLITEARASGLDAVLTIGTAGVTYGVGADVWIADAGLARRHRVVALVPTDGTPPHVWTPWPDGAPPDLPVEHVHPAVDLDDDAGATGLVDAVTDVVGTTAVIGLDDWTWPLRRAFGDRPTTDARPALARARAVKTPDEVSCIATAQAWNEAAMAEIAPLVVPGARGTELGAALVARCVELGSEGPVVEPIFSVVAPSVGRGPRSVTGDVVFPLPPSDAPLAAGDLVWVDTGIAHRGYGSDFGTTFDVGPPPPQRADQWRRLRAVLDAVTAVVRPGATGLDLTTAARAAEDGRRTPWLRHFYLAHGIGTAPAEAPLIGTDLGDEADAAIVLVPGNVVVLEPVVFDDGLGGVRCEEILLVTDDGCERLSALGTPEGL